MGIYINTGNLGFQSARNSEYIDKSGLISVVNSTLFTERRFSCITRCRRFGKSMAAKMLCAYYDQSCDSRSLFADLQIANDPQFEKHLNKYPIIYLDVSDFVTRFKDDTIYMLAGGRSKVNPTKFQNDMSVIRSKDDALTVLIHLGYLGYDWRKDECYIPNKEVGSEMANAVENNNWSPVVNALQQSEQLLADTLAGDTDAVARAIEAVHDENISILSYNNENSLACVLSLAYYYAKNDYIVHRELATGKGFADIVLIPRKNVDSPAIVVELKYNKDADAAIDQIRRKQYPAKVAQYADRLLLVGINYNRETKTHECVISNN